jgi:hypothetical protein
MTQPPTGAALSPTGKTLGPVPARVRQVIQRHFVAPPGRYPNANPNALQGFRSGADHLREAAG